MTDFLEKLLRDLGHLAALMRTLDEAQAAWTRLEGETQSAQLGQFPRGGNDPYVQAFHDGLRQRTTDMPAVLYRMCLVHAYGQFDDYINSLLRGIIHRTPQILLGSSPSQRKSSEYRKLSYKDIIDVVSYPDNHNVSDAIIDRMIDPELRDLAYGSCEDRLSNLRKKYGFKELSRDLDDRIVQLALMRNCVVHNQGIADELLEATSTHFYRRGQRILIDRNVVSRAITVFCKFCTQLDHLAEQKFFADQCQ